MDESELNPVAKKSNKTKNISIQQRFIKMGLANPRLFNIGLKVEYKRRIAQPLARRLHPERASAPACISFQITRRCNLKCHMCVQYRHGVGDKAPLSWYDPKMEISPEAWIKVLDQCKSAKPWISITGGEPTIYNGLKDIIRAKRERNLAGDLTTNGMLLDGFAEFLVEQQMENVIVSLDGPEEYHDEVRGVQGAFRKTINGIKALVEARERLGSYAPIIGLTFVITKLNLESLERMVPLAIDLGVDIMQFSHPIWTSPEKADLHNKILCDDFAEKHGFDLVSPSLPEGEYFHGELTQEDTPAVIESLKKARELAKGKIALNILPSLPDDLIDPYYLDEDYSFPNTCNSLWQKLRIMPDGTVTPCLHVVVGNIKDQSIMDIWKGEKMASFRKVVAKGLFPGCVRCCDRSFKG